MTHNDANTPSTNTTEPITRPAVLTIAGSDPSGGAGVQADLATFHAFGVYATAAITLITVQNTTGVTRVDLVDESLIAEQIDAVLSDIPPACIKIGALGNQRIARIVAEHLQHAPCPIVLDPVMVSKHGHPLVDRSCAQEIRARLIPLCAVLTPNTHEARHLTDIDITTREDMLRAAGALETMGARAVYLSAPTRGIPNPFADDLLLSNGSPIWIEGPLLPTERTHGTGCASSAAIAAGIALGHDTETACRNAKAFITEAIRTAPLRGRGVCPLNLHIAPPPTPAPRSKR
ncbi:MAG: bifunctional hydroxymethylpyrimidine kinase/phosphomethylpyrimidine kinase [Phycisphaerales bacterium]